MLDPRVVHQDVEAPELPHATLHQGSYVLRVGDVRPYGRDSAPGVCYPLDYALGLFRVTSIVHDDCRAFAGEGERDGLTDARRCPRDDGYLAFEPRLTPPTRSSGASRSPAVDPRCVL